MDGLLGKALRDAGIMIENADETPIHVAICTPSVGFMKSRYTACLVRMMLYFMYTPVLGQEKRGRTFSYHQIEGSMVGQAREVFVNEVLSGKVATHLLFIDEDMGFREDTLNIMLSRDMPFVSCNYRMKVPPCPFTCRPADDSGWMETTKEKDSLEEACMTGFGFSLIKREVLEAVSPPRFSNQWVEKFQAYSTEDRSFCQKAIAAGYPPMVDHRASKRVYHMGNWAYSWDDNHDVKFRQPYAERLRTVDNDANAATAATAA